jgi:ribulose-5-phosphate 4-epimerase/fuculose-1-phosphate aldolase
MKHMNDRRKVETVKLEIQIEYWKNVGAAAVGRNDVRATHYAAKQLRRITTVYLNAMATGKFTTKRRQVKKLVGSGVVPARDVIETTL